MLSVVLGAWLDSNETAREIADFPCFLLTGKAYGAILRKYLGSIQALLTTSVACCWLPWTVISAWN